LKNTFPVSGWILKAQLIDGEACEAGAITYQDDILMKMRSSKQQGHPLVERLFSFD
jgi:hypothetical protein